jgi:pyruvate dehydrogenase (quinone)
MPNVADRIVQTLEAANVQRIYGLVGDSLNGITESLRVRDKIKWVAVRHETGSRLRLRKLALGLPLEF